MREPWLCPQSLPVAHPSTSLLGKNLFFTFFFFLLFGGVEKGDHPSNKYSAGEEFHSESTS